MFEVLSDRRKQLFANDHRVVGEWSMILGRGVQAAMRCTDAARQGVGRDS